MVSPVVSQMGLEVSEDFEEKVRKEFRGLESESLLVGIPEDENSRKQSEVGITNSELLFIHTKGSPINNVPPRPVIEPAIESEREKITSKMEKVTKYFADGKIEQAKAALRRLGLFVVGVCFDWFENDANGWPPNTPETIKRKGSDRPLIDTAQLRNAITYVIEGKFGRVK